LLFAAFLFHNSRCFQLLGFDEYLEEMTDGLQILRYNLTTAYISHLDYLEDSSFQEAYDYESSKKGGNRFATILLYFTTLNEGDGGETVFPRVYPPGVAEEDRISESDGLRILRDSGDTKNVLKEGSWEEKMTVLCRTRFSVRPKALRAVLFYSQFPNGTLDPLSYHGGCPVLRGTKLAANLWTWSAIRPEYDGGPIRDGADVGNDSDEDSDRSEADEAALPSSILATFQNSGKDERFRNAELYYDEAGYFGKLGFGDDGIAVNTYSGHVWNIKDQVTKIVLQTFIISDSGEDQVFEI
jgi:2OG-Fe(II) oxygenase superfamily